MAKKKKNPKRRVLTEWDFKKRIEEHSENLMIILLMIPLKVLHDVFGFGPKRLELFIDEYLKTWNDWHNGWFEPQDLLEWFNEYMGIDIVKRYKGEKDNE